MCQEKRVEEIQERSRLIQVVNQLQGSCKEATCNEGKNSIDAMKTLIAGKKRKEGKKKKRKKKHEKGDQNEKKLTNGFFTWF